ncbi:FKBP-type peptidyl-prolyl cis-trans isomerase [Wenzhouxiangella marina]|uniref:Peptidyl-prolyl cis-trans isomerase n=1 Tax=Wenzhouxiangella marina TaxID=1579979 RepID=A0A0K0XW81_9GAMM|nr:peptidylprolyl isomerase [Wenzhouxiangella marina]AKS41876.1 peptidylprolyl isomerase [Wenzhouxiangella marina]MBB6086358.1 FKBP-type peptidyl-prolyl cis-trans isomerase SlyD [Wenzhouxiangella marina]
MQISNNSVVAIEYTLTGDDGQVIDTSEGREPLVYLHGHNNIIPGLEKAMEGKEAGAELDVQVPPEEGYGQYRQELVQDVPRSAFDGQAKVEPGMSFRAESNAGPMTVLVREVKEDTVTIDGNHMLAGKVLNFKVEIKSVRPATEEEISQGVAQAA